MALTIEGEVFELKMQVKELKQEIEELKNKEKQETKQHKSLSDYRYYEKLKDGEKYKTFDKYNEIMEEIWSSADLNIAQFKIGNVYSIDTPNELLEREIKKRQLWFELEKHLKEKGCLASSEEWEDESKLKYFVCFNYSNKSFEISCNSNRKDNTIYSTDIIVLKNYMNTLTNEDIKIMFDVE